MASPRPVVAPPRSRLPWWASSLVLAGAAAACRTGAAPKPGAPSPASPDFIRASVGQTAILRYRGDERRWSLDRKSVERQSGACDVAVEVKDAALQKGVLQIRLEYLGQPRVEGKRGDCRRQVPEIELRITGFRPDEPAEAVAPVVGRLLQSPEAWLAAHGIRFDLPPAAEPSLVADRSPVGKEAEMRLAREVTRWPRTLLSVEPAYADPARKVRHEGEIEIAAIVGPDGRLHDARVLTPLDEAHGRQVRRSFPLWRFEPARRGSSPVAARLSERTVFRVY